MAYVYTSMCLVATVLNCSVETNQRPGLCDTATVTSGAKLPSHGLIDSIDRSIDVSEPIVCAPKFCSLICKGGFVQINDEEKEG